MSTEVIEVLKNLVSIDTTSSKTTLIIAEYISDYLESFGFTVDKHSYNLKGVEKINVIARLGEGDIHLALAGHMDTVPFDSKEWHTNPLDLVKVGDKWFGRGVCDMKGFLALAMVVGSKISKCQLKRPFGLVFTSDEEVGCIGAKNLIRDRGKISEMYIIGEPTEMHPYILHKGYMYVIIELQGKGGHSSRPSEGVNVVEQGLVPVLERIKNFRLHLGEIRDVRLEPPYPTLNVGVVSTGESSAKNIISDYCKVELDIRPVPGQDVQEIFDAFSRYLTECMSKVKGVEIKIRLGRAPTPPMETPVNSLVVQEAEKMCGHAASSTSFNTEGGVFNASGSSSVICGLGSIQQAHKPNEFIHEMYLTETVVTKYISTILNICGKGV